MTVVVTSKPAVGKNVVARNSGVDFVLFDPECNRIFELNEIAMRVIGWLDGKRTVSDVARKVAEEYDVTPQQAETDILQLLNGLREAGLQMTVA